MTLQRAQTKKYGGNAKKATSGKQHQIAVDSAHIALIRKSGLATMTWPPLIQNYPLSGIMKETGRIDQKTPCMVQGKKSGGDARNAHTNGKQL